MKLNIHFSLLLTDPNTQENVSDFWRRTKNVAHPVLQKGRFGSMFFPFKHTWASQLSFTVCCPAILASKISVLLIIRYILLCSVSAVQKWSSHACVSVCWTAPCGKNETKYFHLSAVDNNRFTHLACSQILMTHIWSLLQKTSGNSLEGRCNLLRHASISQLFVHNQPVLLLPQRRFRLDHTCLHITNCAVAKYEYMGSSEQDTTWELFSLFSTIVYCVNVEALPGCESQGEESIPLLPTLSVTINTDPALSGDLVRYSVSFFPTQPT